MPAHIWNCARWESSDASQALRVTGGDQLLRYVTDLAVALRGNRQQAREGSISPELVALHDEAGGLAQHGTAGQCLHQLPVQLLGRLQARLQVEIAVSLHGRNLSKKVTRRGGLERPTA